MSFLNGLIDEVLTVLKNDSVLSGVAFVGAYPVLNKPNPLKKSVLAVGISKIKAEDGALGAYLGESSQGSLYGKRIEVTLGLRLYTPPAEGGSKCTALFSDILDCLLFSKEFSAGAAECSPVSYNSAVSAFSAQGTLTLRLYAAARETEGGIREITVRHAL